MRVIASPKLPRDSGGSIFAARHLDVSQSPLGWHWPDLKVYRFNAGSSHLMTCASDPMSGRLKRRVKERRVFASACRCIVSLPGWTGNWTVTQM